MFVSILEYGIRISDLIAKDSTNTSEKKVNAKQSSYEVSWKLEHPSMKLKRWCNNTFI